MAKIALNIPDCHIPWHDEKAYQLMIMIAEDVNKMSPINEINIMGDFADFYWFTLHDKLPSGMSIKETLKDEIYQVIKKLEELRQKFPQATINYIEGNHEFRMVRYIVKKCPELFDLFSLSELLQFDRLSVNHIPFGKSQLHSCLGTSYYLRHQPYNQGKNCASSTAHNKCISLGFGHTHRKQHYEFNNAHNEVIECYSMGWLGNRNAPVFDYMDCDNWTLGFQFFYLFPNTTWIVDPVTIKNHMAVYNGFQYKM